MVSLSSSPLLHLQISGGKRLPTPPPSSVRVRAVHESRVASTCLSQYPKVGSNRTSLYEVLRVPVGATGMEIKAAYRKLARIFHPDVDGRDSSCGHEFIKIHDAYSTLSDPDKRADYDRRLHVIPSYSNHQRSPRRYDNNSPVGYSPRRNWDTDQCW